jgi:SAM-dependent methyltransferase
MADDRANNFAGYSADAYRFRAEGSSPESIRDEAWNIVGPKLQGVVLDAGAGGGGWTRRLRDNPQVRKIINADLVLNPSTQLEGIDYQAADLSVDALPCETESLDWVFAIEVIEHLANPRHFIAEAYRCLKAGGHLFITTPSCDSLTARLSLLFRGYFPAFCEHDYCLSGHITPVTELDLKRMTAEARFNSIDFYYPLPGRIPKSEIHWQKFFPWLHGKLWSDGLFALIRK